MMKIHFKIFCLALFVISFASCKKDSTTTPPVKMGATIDGKVWDSSLRGTTLQNNVFIITGTSSSLEIITITINGSTTGTYTLSVLPPSSAQCAASYTIPVIGGAPIVYASADGKVVLTKVDTGNHLISGTFEFTLTNGSATKSITKGQFNDLSYQ